MDEDVFLGEIRLFAGILVPRGWVLCNGQLLSASDNPYLFSLLGNSFGGDSSHFAVPNLAPLKLRDDITIPYIICTTGDFPVRGVSAFLGEIRLLAAPNTQYWPENFTACNGATLQVNDNQALFSVLDTAYGGSVTDQGGTFLLPSLPPLQPTQGPGIAYQICAQGFYPTNTGRMEGYVGVLRNWAPVHPYNLPQNWSTCSAQPMTVGPDNIKLFEIIGLRFGGFNQVFHLPNANPLPTAQGPALPYLICTDGLFPQFS
jgi:microcystin-dependent protein